MKKLIAVVVAIVALSSPLLVLAEEHVGHRMDHITTIAHEEVVSGIKASFSIQTMADAMKGMGMEIPKGLKETHHVSVSFKDVKTGKMVTEATVGIKVQNPDKTTINKDMSGMKGHFGADFDFSKQGKYGVMCKFVTTDGKSRQAKFWYTVK